MKISTSSSDRVKTKTSLLSQFSQIAYSAINMPIGGDFFHDLFSWKNLAVGTNAIEALIKLHIGSRVAACLAIIEYAV